MGFSEDCRKGKNKIKMPTTLEWVEMVSKENNSSIDIEYIKDMAHGGFLGPVNIQTRNFGRGPIGWSMGGTPAARDKMMSIIRGFLRK
jgi:hypothetical protein